MISVCDIATVFKFITIMKTKNIIEKKKDLYAGGRGKYGQVKRWNQDGQGQGWSDMVS